MAAMPVTRRTLTAAALTLPALAMSAPHAFADAPVPAPGKPLRILILGGTGFTGPNQVRYALARGHSVTLFNRGRQHEDWPGPVEELIGDRNTGDLKALKGREWDVCIDNPTTLPFWVRDAGRVLAGKVGQYIFISTISAYASDAAVGQNESAPTAPYTGADPLAETPDSFKAHPDLYGPLKAASEREAVRQFGVGAVTVIRPGLIVGPGDETDRFTYWPVRLSRAGAVLAPGDGTDPVQFIDARDLAEWTIRMAERRTIGVFNGDGPAHTLTMKGMLEQIGGAEAFCGRLVWVPAAFLDAQKVEAWSDMPVWVPGFGDTAGFARRSNAKAIAAGLTFRPLETTTKDTLAWFKTLPANRQAKLRSGVTPDREAAVIKAWEASGGKA